MAKKYVNLHINLDERDASGKPTVIQIPKDAVPFHHADDIVLFSISIIEDGVETVVKRNAIYDRNVWNDPDLENPSYKFVMKETVKEVKQ